MGDLEVVDSRWKLVEVGRVVLFSAPSPYENRIAVIVEIIDHKRVLVDGPSSQKGNEVPRHAAPLSNIALTHIVIDKLPLGIGHAALKGKWAKDNVEKKWKESAFAKSRASIDKRKALNDFERFKVMRLRKRVRHAEKRALAKVKASA